MNKQECWEEEIIEAILAIRNDDATPVQKIVKINGFDVGLQYLPGDIRHGKEMKCSYGHIRNHVGEDGMALDAYIGSNPESKKAFILRQLDKDGNLDEFKVMLGFDSKDEAQAAYCKAIAPERFGGIKPISLEAIAQYKKDSFEETALAMAGFRLDTANIRQDFDLLYYGLFGVRLDSEDALKDNADYIAEAAEKKSAQAIERWVQTVEKELTKIAEAGGDIKEAIARIDSLFELPEMVKSSKALEDELAAWKMVAHLDGQEQGMEEMGS